MRGLKILVVVMGVMLVAGLVALVAAIAVRLSHRAPSPPSVAFTAPPVTLPHGSTIETMSVGTDRIVLQVDLADGSVELVVIDLATGRLLGAIPLREAP
ncbi:MAG TPA: DUF6476 family protein [Stellaceae bacterium]|nr:DUF6476 family protein [Stellaceae bacterium]